MSHRLLSSRLLTIFGFCFGLAGCGGSGMNMPSGPGGGSMEDTDDSQGMNQPTTCTATGTPVELVSGEQLDDLKLMGDRLFFIQKRRGFVPSPGSVHSVKLDGSSNTELFAGAENRKINQIYVQETEIFLVIDEVDSYGQGEAGLYRMPLSGGSPSRLPTTIALDHALTRIVGADASFLYLYTRTSQQRLWRVDKSSGNAVDIGGPGQFFFGIQMVGSDIWYTGNDDHNSGTFKISTVATSPTQTFVSTESCPALGMFITPDAIFCGDAFSIDRYDLTLKGRTPLFKLAYEDNRVNLMPVGVDDDDVYVNDFLNKDLYRVQKTGGTLQPVVCGTHGLANLQITPNALYWTSIEYFESNVTRILRFAK